MATTGAPGPREFRDSFGEELRDVLDVGGWEPRWDLAAEYPRVEREVREAIRQEGDYQRWAREHLFPRLFDDAAVPGGGVYRASTDAIRLVHRGLLFNGGVEACDAT